MRLEVDQRRCQGHTMCALNAPDLFDLSDDDGHAVVKLPEVPVELADGARSAADGCPEGAIALFED